MDGIDCLMIRLIAIELTSWYGERISTDQTLDRRRRIVAVNVVVTLNIMKTLNYHVKVSKMIINVLI